MCKRLGPVRVKRSKYPLLLFQLTRRVGGGGGEGGIVEGGMGGLWKGRGRGGGAAEENVVGEGKGGKGGGG